jgi:hypothetical protein
MVNQTGPAREVGTTSLTNIMPESTIAARLGLTRVVCAALRREHLEPQVDYMIEHKRVMITEAGYARVQ